MFWDFHAHCLYKYSSIESYDICIMSVKVVDSLASIKNSIIFYPSFTYIICFTTGFFKGIHMWVLLGKYNTPISTPI